MLGGQLVADQIQTGPNQKEHHTILLEGLIVAGHSNGFLNLDQAGRWAE